MERKKFSVERFLLILFFTIIIFSSGIYLGNYLTQEKMKTLSTNFEQLKLETQEVDLEFQLMEDSICSNEAFRLLTDRLDKWGQKLEFMENDLGKDDETVVFMKRNYFILQLRHWLLSKKQLELCNLKPDFNNTIILYFYSNEDDCDFCEKQGLILSHLKNKYKDIKIYSFDLNYDSNPLKLVKEKYGVDKNPPILIINEKHHSGYLDLVSLENYIKNQIEKN